ncbi:flagellar biosynthesis protein FlhB [Photobacterium sp. BZF1]|uniref:flagellar biosynthesis protein FlhB n=1 Tax=Photobacterium sp. BZF1 TaxID=1904457 RepID=UPI0016537DCF|nr:flagellar biosynthesis protein FlhB [Photobacterium sp. BZF1]MBC7001590.1 flagellar biosynthesis protein FlhB [Photobacterium sp. BZF1]
MADNQDASDKSELPSQHKLAKARREGQIPRAKEFVSSITLICVVTYYLLNIESFKETFIELFLSCFQFNGHTLSHTYSAVELLQVSLFTMVKLFFPLLIYQFIAAVIGSNLLGGWVFNPSLLAPKIEKISPIKGLKRIFSLQSVTELIKNTIKVILFFALLYWVISTHTEIITNLVRSSFNTTIMTIATITIEFIGYLLMIVLLFGLLDFPYQRYEFTKQMKMTKQEVKDEHKEQEGRPEVKARIRQIQTQNAKRNANERVPKANVILTNPTHYSVALVYDTQQAEAPFVVAKGQDEVAHFIKELALKHKVEVIESPELTRAIYSTTQIDQMIPNQLFIAVAHILTYVNQLKQWRKGKMAKPQHLPQFDIPKAWSDIH